MSNQPTIPILLLGDASVGKSTFLTRLAHGPSSTHASPHITISNPTILDLRKPPYRLEFTTLSSWPTRPTSADPPGYETPEEGLFLEGAIQPPPQPRVVILCYDVASRQSLEHVRSGWSKLVVTEMNWDEGTPTMLLGLRRDLRGTTPRRRDRDPDDMQDVGQEGDEGGEEEDEWVLPQEGLLVAQELRCDRYAECSAFTGELVREVWEDVVKMAIGTLQGWGGGRSQGATCCCM